MTIDQRGAGLWRRIAPAQRTAFFACLIAGLLVHLYAFTNLIPNSDGLGRVYDLQQMTISGRWFLHYASALNDYTQMPAAIGLLSLLLLAAAAALTVSLLRLDSRVLAGLSGAVMAAFPVMGYTFLYLFTASAYCLAILLAVLSVWLARRGTLLSWAAGAAVLALSMGTYQAYAAVAISLSLLVVFRTALDPESSFQSTLRLGLRLMAYLAAGALLYYGVLLLFLQLKGLELLSYLGMDAASSGYPFSRLPRLILNCYKQVVSFFFLPGSDNGFADLWMVLLDLAALALGGACFLLHLGKRGLYRDSWRPLTALAMAALLPLGMDFGQILSPWSVPTPLMKYAFLSVYLLVLLAVGLVDGQGASAGLGALPPAAVLWGALLLMFCLNTNNLLYTASAQAHRATESYLTRLFARVEACPGYEPGMEVAVIGAIPGDQLTAQIESYGQVDHYSVPRDTVATLNKHIYYYLNDWLNIPVAEPEEDIMIAVAASPEFQAMPLYPAQGSVQVVDGRVVVKLQEEYTPKSDFEIAYENRR